MNIIEIEKNMEDMMKNYSKEEFIFDLLLAYGTPKATITLLKTGKHNLSKKDNEIILKRKLFFQIVNNADLHETIDLLQKDSATKRYSPRFIVVTDYETLLAVDTKTDEHLDTKIKDIAKRYDFFLPWAGIEKHRHINENPADRKAAEKMAKLYDEILVENSIVDEERIHALNVFLSRLLFCFFAEDTNIFDNKIFTNSIASHTQNDGSDFGTYLDMLFDVLNSEGRTTYPEYLQRFPYVNGGLFAKKQWIPIFTTRSRKIIIECGELDWSKINPDIFGSMMQAVVHPSERGSLGMHYTSVPNIMKVIEPLFLNDLKKEFEQNKSNKKKLQELLSRIANIKFFDPACGSGNFLIITYKELRRLEVKIIKELGVFAFPGINLFQFYGIEIDDFAHEIAKLSLYLAEHQMNIEFQEEFGKVNPTLPLKTGGNIICANATRVDWEDVCPKNENDEIYILGNPPYLGTRNQEKEHKEDMAFVFDEIKDYKKLDYISCWFLLGAEYIQRLNGKLAFVSTNSICQGEQVALIWPLILKNNLEIFFAHQSFKWTNSARKNAGVTVVIIGIRNTSNNNKIIYGNNQYSIVKNINSYLTAGDNIYIKTRSKPLSKIPEMCYGNYTGGCNELILSPNEMRKIVNSDPNSYKFIRRFIGSAEFIKGQERYCLWIRNEDLSQAVSINEVNLRIEAVKKNRLSSKDENIQKLAQRPHQFRDLNETDNSTIIVPITSSERRQYIPCGFLGMGNIIPNSAQAIYNAEPWIFGVISSRIHMVWIRAVCGSLETRIRYSSALGYNTFPISSLTTKQKADISRHVFNILEEREKHPENTIAEMYDPDYMPTELKEVHHNLDLAVERCYRSKPFTSDEERLEYLFKLYEQMIDEEKNINYKINF